MMFFHQSLALKISMAIVLVETIVLSSLGYYYIHRFSTRVDSQLQTQIEIPGNLMRDGVLRYTAVRDLEAIKRLVQQNIIQAMVIQCDGKVFYASNSKWEGESIYDLPTSFGFKLGKTQTETQTIRNKGETRLNCLSPLFSNTKLIGYLYLSIDTSQAEQEKTALTLQYILLTVLCIMLTSVIEILTIHYLVNPRIRASVKCLQQVENGNINTSLDISTSQDEIGILQQSINAMIIGIQERTRAMKEIQQKLSLSEEKLNALFTSMIEMVVMHELVLNAAGEAIDYRIIDCNKVFTEITGICKEDAIGKLASEVYQTDPPPYLEKYAKVAQGGDPLEFTTFDPLLDKHLMISVISPQSGNFSTITTDISIMMQVQEMIMAKNKEMENYLYITSHDLRTPLVNIQGFSQRLKKQVDSIKILFADKTLEPEIVHQLALITDKNIPKTVSFILGNIEKMDTLINGLLQLSRTGRVEMNIQKIDMNELFTKILYSLDFQIKETQCEIHLNPLPDCYGDAVLLDQLFVNIINNALKYSDSERALEITVEAKKTYNKVVYTIRDTGKGIAQKYLEKIWDIFFRIDPRAGKIGEGIGLSLVKQIAEKHKGKVWAESEENRGSVFHIELNNYSFTEL